MNYCTLREGRQPDNVYLERDERAPASMEII